MKSFKKQVKNVVRVLYRATPKHKHMFVALMKMTGSNCAVTADGLNDARALSAANVGFAMGLGGCAVAKDHADIIILDDNFKSVYNAIKWGRNIFDNCRKFLTFQMTVNISCLFIVAIAGATLGKSPFSVIQLLWLNLVMDTLAALALGTEAPHPTVLRKERIKKKDKIMLPIMWRSILSQFIYQALVMVILLYFGPSMFDISYDLVSTELRENGAPTNRLVHYTFLF